MESTIPGTLPESFEWINRLQRYPGNPVLRPNGASYCADAIFNPAATVKDGKVHLLCRCIDFARRPSSPGNWSVSSFGWAVSEDGFTFTMSPTPVPEFFPGPESPFTGGFEDPRLVKIGRQWLLTYTGVYSGPSGRFNTMTPGLAALSDDLVHWEMLGEILPSRAIAVTPEKINGKYWAYYDNWHLRLAWSEDLRNWHLVDAPVLSPRPGKFDECLCEAVAAPIISDDGILLLYNGDAGRHQAETLAMAVTPSYLPLHPMMFYSVGWALFDRNDPSRLIARCDRPVIAPKELYEFYGIAPFACFASGVVEFKGRHIIYYGCADMRISAAFAECK